MAFYVLKGTTMDSAQFFTDASDFFASNVPVTKDVYLPEMTKPGEPLRGVVVQSMSGPEKVSLDGRRWDPTKAPGDPDRFRSKWFEEDRPCEMLAMSVVRPDGTKLFTTADARTLKTLNPKSFARLYAAAQEVNGEDTAELKLSGKAGPEILSGDNGSASLTTTDIQA